MTTLDVVSEKKKSDPSAEETDAKELVHLSRVLGLSLTGPDVLLKHFTKTVLETVLNSRRRSRVQVPSGSLPTRALTQSQCCDYADYICNGSVVDATRRSLRGLPTCPDGLVERNGLGPLTIEVTSITYGSLATRLGQRFRDRVQCMTAAERNRSLV